MSHARSPALAGFSAAAAWLGEEPRWSNPQPTAFTIEAPPETDLFVHPGAGSVKLDAPAWLTPAVAPATLRALVKVDFRDTFDAAALVVFEAPDRWAKLCSELSPDGRPMVVSVVTRGTSDDANAGVLSASTVWLRISLHGNSCFAFHTSSDGAHWDLVRHFRLSDEGAAPRVGFAAQAPTGVGCVAHFERIALTQGVEVDIRSGK